MIDFIPILILALALTTIEAFAQNSLKLSQIHNCQYRFIFGLLFYVCVGLTLRYSYDSVGLGQMNLVWSSCSIITAIVIGYLLYDEPFNTFTLIAILFALSAVFCSHLANQQST